MHRQETNEDAVTNSGKDASVHEGDPIIQASNPLSNGSLRCSNGDDGMTNHITDTSPSSATVSPNGDLHVTFGDNGSSARPANDASIRSSGSSTLTRRSSDLSQLKELFNFQHFQPHNAHRQYMKSFHVYFKAVGVNTYLSNWGFCCVLVLPSHPLGTCS